VKKLALTFGIVDKVTDGCKRRLERPTGNERWMRAVCETTESTRRHEEDKKYKNYKR